MTTDQLRQVLSELDGKRSAVFTFAGAAECVVHNAMLIPDEKDHMVKVTDGKHVYIIDAAPLVWIRIG
ncbi:MAG: hypothetical protein IPJ41_04465 [Phycisphaerales bacterium]|nr:hypothetical protein [Phycisphaerales bacterium]